MNYWRKVFKEKARQNAQERYNQLRILGLAKGKKPFFGSHPELDVIIQEVLDDAVKHGIIDELPDGKKDLEQL